MQLQNYCLLQKIGIVKNKDPKNLKINWSLPLTVLFYKSSGTKKHKAPTSLSQKTIFIREQTTYFWKNPFFVFLNSKSEFQFTGFFLCRKVQQFFFLNHEYPSPIYNVKLPEDVIGHSSQIAILTIFSKTRECWCIDFANYTMYKSSIE